MKNLKIYWDAIKKKMYTLKYADCHIYGYHAHKYVNEDGLVRYLPMEKHSYKGFKRCEEYVTLHKEQKDLIDFMVKKGLLEIQDNTDVIKRIQDNNHDYIEYYYEYTTISLVPMTVGKTTQLMPVNKIEDGWTTNPNHSDLTGKTRLCHHEYTSYKIVVDDRGRYALEECPDKEDILSHKDEYPFIKVRFCNIAYYDNDLDKEETNTKRH